MGATLDGAIATASYGFGSVMGQFTAPDGDTLPLGVSNATQLTLANTGTNAAGDFIWDDAASDTAGAWLFGSGAPKLIYNDYDGAGDMFGCSGSPTILIPDCRSLIPGQL